MTISTFVLAMIALISEKLELPTTLVSIPLAPMLAMGALGVFNTALAYYAYFRLVNEEGATFASLNNYIVPLIGVIAGAVALANHSAIGLGGTGACALRRRPHRPIAAAGESASRRHGPASHSRL